MKDKILIREEFKKCPFCNSTVTFTHIPGDAEISLQTELAATLEKLARAEKVLNAVGCFPEDVDNCDRDILNALVDVALGEYKAYREVSDEAIKACHSNHG